MTTQHLKELYEKLDEAYKHLDEARDRLDLISISLDAELKLREDSED